MAHEPVDLVDDVVASADPRRPAPPPSFAELAARLASLVRPRAAVLLAVALLGVGAAAATWALLRPPELPPTEELLPYAPGSEHAGTGGGDSAAPATPSPTSSTSVASLVVHAAGAVVVPGIHAVPPGSRVSDLLAAAGGPAPDADLDRVNLAAPVADGERVWFPRIGEEAEPPVVAGAGGGAAPGDGGSPAPIDLNVATAEELDVLPGVGPATAAAILEHRSTHGPFTSVEELLDVPGIGEAKLEQLRDLVTV